MSTLSEITHIEPDVLAKKFRLEPRSQFSPQGADNLVFLTPTILLKDLELRLGGVNERGAKDVLGLVTKDILTDNDSSLIQVPEIIYLHMGYGKKATNKEKKLAITDEEAKFWFDHLNLARFRDGNPAVGEEEPREGEEPMIIDFPTQDDTQAFDEDTVDPRHSGLQIPEKGSYILFFSILLMFDKKRRSRRHAANVQHKKPGPNKVSDFLLFWIIPYLLNYSERKVTEIVKHNKANGKPSPSTVKKSTMDIFHAAVSENGEMLPEQKDNLEDKYRKYYGTDIFEKTYTLLASEGSSPIILVPMEYQVSNSILPATIRDLGRRETWQRIGSYSFTDEFLSRFVPNRDIQKDFFNSMKDIKHRQAIDYGIILPDEKTYVELNDILVRDCPDRVRSYKECQAQGRDFIAPRVGLVKYIDEIYDNVTVAFSYLQGKGREKVAALFRAIGSHYRNHFTLGLLHGSVCNSNDPDCVLGNLYPIEDAFQVFFKRKHFQRGVSLGENYDLKNRIGKFTGVDFPQTYKSWQQEIFEDEGVKEVLLKNNIKPEFHQSKPLVVGYSQEKFQQQLKKARFKAAMTLTKPDKGKDSVKVSNRKKLSSSRIKAVNLDGCALSLLAKHGRKNNLGVVLAINDTLEVSNLVLLPDVVRTIVVNFVKAVVIAGLPLVYPSEQDAEDRDEQAMAETVSSSSDDDDDDDDDDDSPDDENNQSEPMTPPFKQGTPSTEELEYLATDIGATWKKLGRRLRIANGELIGFHKDYDELSEKAYQMLLHWLHSNAADATYEVLFYALSHELVGRRDLAMKYCCK